MAPSTLLSVFGSSGQIEKEWEIYSRIHSEEWMFWNRSRIQNSNATLLSISSEQTTSLHNPVICTVQHQQRGLDVPRCATARACPSLVISASLCFHVQAGTPLGSIIPALHYVGCMPVQGTISSRLQSRGPGAHLKPRHRSRTRDGKLQATLVSASQPLRLSLCRPMSFRSISLSTTDFSPRQPTDHPNTT